MRRLALLLGVLMAGPALSQTATMRSGEHDTFTRLTLPLPSGTGFTLAEAPGRAVLRFSGSLEAVDLSRVYDRIGRSRLANIVTSPGPTVELSLACDCPVETTLAASNLLIIDIENGPALENDPVDRAEIAVQREPVVEDQRAATARPVAPTPPPRPLPNLPLSLGLPPIDPLAIPEEVPSAPIQSAGANQANGSGIVTPPRPGSGQAAHSPEDGPSSPSPREDAVPAIPDTDAPTPLSPVTLPAPPRREVASQAVSTLPGMPSLSDEEAQLTRELEERLLTAIGNAATEGLLTPDASQAANLAEEQRRISQARADGTHSDPGLAATPSTFAPDDPDASGRIVLSGNPCALQMPSLDAPAEPVDFTLALAEKRAGLTGEFDRDNVAAYHDLAHFYLLHGFGAEAGRVLEAVQQPPGEAEEMASAARILDFGHDPQPSPFSGRLTCDTDAALWAALAPRRLPPGSNFDGAAIKRTLMAMPAPLKSVLGPLLAERFTAAGEGDFARDLLRIVDRGVTETTPRRDLAEARLAGLEAPADKSRLDALIAGNSEVSPDALLFYTNEALENGDSIGAETIGLLESYRAQYRNDPLAIELARAEVLAHASSGNFPAAFALYEETRDKFMPETGAELVDSLGTDLARAASDAIFTRLYFTHAEELARRAGPATVNDLADRLLALGLAEVADPLLAEDEEGDAGRRRQVLRARAALALNLPRRAFADLDGLEGEEADRLRAEASLVSADFAEATALFTAAGAAEAAEDAAWLARDWDRLEAAREETKARLASVVSNQEPIDLPALGPPTLAASREVLSQSGETREALRDLLSTLEVDNTPDP